MKHTYLFVLERGLVSRYRFRTGLDKRADYLLVKYSNDEKARAFSDSKIFWETWKEDAGFSDGDSMDAALLSDDRDFQLALPADIPVCDPTEFFTRNRIRCFLEEAGPYSRRSHISLCYEGGWEPVKNNLDAINGEGIRFFLTIFFPAARGDDIPPPSRDGRYTLGDYFHEEKEGWNSRQEKQ